MGANAELLAAVALSRPGLGRHAERRTEPDLVATLLADPVTRVLELHGDRAAVEEHPSGTRLALRAPQAGDGAHLVLFLGQEAAGPAYLAVALPARQETAQETGQESAQDAALRGLRQVGADLPDLDATVFVTALSLANWHATHPRCPRCGAATEPVQAGWLRRCPQDDSEHYPRTDVAVIMSVVDDHDRLLLARGVGWPEGRFSVLAGFLEPGEAMAAAVAREVREEVGLEVTDVEYLGDQPWPFPSSIMVGFTARAVGSRLRLQESEIAQARWFSREEYRAELEAGSMIVSSRLSIARRLVERWLGQDLDELRPRVASSPR